ncbi:TdeIII family type II restriction endonuclease [Candidatus Shapirobacteria bacterium CG03_land_8_20_14_0_80_40_19]|uniref:type II site-specific deoxyribonuclease n=2 Tax=Candidatus Shapironibacteriota TaxID=1752721 RepID=A0A2M7BG10_9BACT|nr:MAG: restriction endonuclease [Candidatus Shapirobacteria bacterium CG11_big_fil_rev_8_21_14_0_20_40_12]PIV02051.1 MAG: TdeIII family type II restriction endonuclease [Candidatus Shapirobacteria bacterium CG03_land_8_20_14_0_80_40_19]
MALNKGVKNRIGEVAKTILLSRIESFPDETTKIRNAPFHKAFLECFENRIKPLKVELPYLVAIASWLHGLNTSLGSGFENIAHILSGGCKRNFSGHYILKVKKTQSQKIEEIVRDLKTRGKPNLEKENEKIFKFNSRDIEVNCLPFTVDNYFETEKLVDAIEMKSVRPNSGEGRGEKQKILYAKSALKLLTPNKVIRYYIGFPFDPTSDESTKYDKERFFNYLIEFKKFFSPEEVLLSSELWDHLSGQQNTMEEVLEVISQTVKEIKISP